MKDNRPVTDWVWRTMLVAQIVAASVLLALLTAASGQDGGPEIVETFSAAQKLPEIGSLAGPKLQLTISGVHVTAILTDYEGAARAMVTHLHGLLHGGQIELTGRNSRGPVSIRGRQTPAKFEGTIRRTIGGTVYRERVIMRRIVNADLCCDV